MDLILQQILQIIERRIQTLQTSINELMENLTNIYNSENKGENNLSELNSLLKKLEQHYTNPKPQTKIKSFKVKKVESIKMDSSIKDSEIKYITEGKEQAIRPKSKCEKLREQIEKSKYYM